MIIKIIIKTVLSKKITDPCLGNAKKQKEKVEDGECSRKREHCMNCQTQKRENPPVPTSRSDSGFYSLGRSGSSSSSDTEGDGPRYI